MHFSQPQFWTKIVFFIVIYRRPFSVDSLRPVHPLIVTPETPYGTNLCSTSCSLQIRRDKGRTIRYLGGARVFVACKLFFLPPRENNLFFGDQRPTIFFYVSSKTFFVVCFLYYVRYHLVFFLVNIFFINFDNTLFFCPHFKRTFFSDFCGDKLFFSIFSSPPPPPPRYQMVRP